MSLRTLWDDQKIKMLLFLWLFYELAFAPSFLMYAMLNSHRYLLPAFLLFALLTGYILLEKYKSVQGKKILYILSILILISGSFWKYPDKIATGWDSTLAYLPYIDIKREMIQSLDDQRIDLSTVGTLTPNLSPINLTELNNDGRKFSPLNLKTQKYVFYTNVCNGFSDDEIDELNTHWIKIKEIRQLTVHATLFKKQD
jgi:hypothetical protein